MIHQFSIVCWAFAYNAIKKKNLLDFVNVFREEFASVRLHYVPIVYFIMMRVRGCNKIAMSLYTLAK